MTIGSDMGMANYMRILRDPVMVLKEACSEAALADMRPSALAATIGFASLAKWSGRSEDRRRNSADIASLLEPYGAYLDTQRPHPAAETAATGFPLIVKPDAPFSTAELARHFQSAAIETQQLFTDDAMRILARTGAKHRIAGPLEVLDSLGERAFWIGIAYSRELAPVFSNKIARCLESFFTGRR